METPKRDGRDPKRWLDIHIEHRTRGRAVNMLLWFESLEVRMLAGWIELQCKVFASQVAGDFCL